MRSFQKKYIIIIAVSFFLCGCNSKNNKLTPMNELSLPETVTKEETTLYTGTTVDFYYMETTSSVTAPSYGLEMPEMPDFPSVYNQDDPFDEQFQALFDNYTFPSMDTNTGSAVTSVTEASENTDTLTETASVSESEITSDNDFPNISVETVVAETPSFDNTETAYNISEYIPENIFILQ